MDKDKIGHALVTRLKEICSICRFDGWLDGQGKRLDYKDWAWLEKLLLVFPNEDSPLMFPTEDGNIVLEWPDGTGYPSLEITKDGTGIWHYMVDLKDWGSLPLNNIRTAKAVQEG